MENDEDGTTPVLILDPGAWIIKIGFADDEMPAMKVPCVYIEKTFINSKIIKFGTEAIDDYILIKYGNANSEKQEEKVEDGNHLVNVKLFFADPRHPMSTNNFADLFEMYNYLINKLNINTSEYSLLVSIPETIEKLFLSNLLNWAFTHHEFLSISLIFNSLAASYYYGVKTTLVIDMGECGSRIVPIAEGHGVFSYAIQNCEIGGHLISKYISNFVKINDEQLDYTLIQDYKELNSYISLDIDNNIRINTDCNGLVKPYRIPNSNIYIDPKMELLSHEIFFQPEFLAHLPGNFYKQSIVPLSQLIFETIHACPLDLRKMLLNNIILIGGVSSCINFSSRLTKELMNIIKSKHYSDSMTVHIKQVRMSDIASYLGCKKYGKLLFYNKKKWVLREEYSSATKNQIVQKLLLWANTL